MKTLVLAEKPSLAKEVAFALSNDFKKNEFGFWENPNIIVANLVGHVIKLDLPSDKWDIEKIPVNLKNLKYIPIDDKKKLVSNLVNTIKRNDVTEICSCGDADQEGSLLIHEIILFSGAYSLNKKLTRMWLLAMDEKTINTAYNNRYNLVKDKPFINGGLARSYADLVIGLNLTQLYTLKFAPNKQIYSIGRVQTPTLKLVRLREIEIEDFKPEKYSVIKGKFTNDLNANLVFLENDKYSSRLFENKKNEQIQLLGEKSFVVVDVKEEEKNIKSDYLPNLNDVLKNTAKIYKYKAKMITADIQHLYELKLISYPRSESRFLPTSMEKDIEKILNSFNVENVIFDVNNKRIFNDEKVEAHFAIIPLGLEEKIETLTEAEKNIYNYIKDKFIMAFMQDYKYKSTVITLKNSLGAYFQTKGQIELQKGFRSYKSILNKHKDDVILPLCKKDDIFSLLSYNIVDEETEPPVLLNEAELLSIMENISNLYKKENKDDDNIFEDKFSLGTPATRGNIIELLFDRNFMLSDKKGYLTTTDIGKELLNIVGDDISINLTADFEKKMQLIQKGNHERESFEKEIELYTYELIDKIKKLDNTNKKLEQQFETGELCPDCNSPLIYKNGKFGKFIACSNYPNCKFIKKEKKDENINGVIEFSKGFKIIKEQKEYIIWKNNFGRDFKIEEIIKLFNGEELKLKEFVSFKTKKKFEAICFFNFDENKLVLKF